MAAEREPINMDGLSFDAKVVAGSCFGIMGPASTLTYQMKESRPGDRMQAALNELVDASVLSVEPCNGRGGKTYRPLMNCNEAFKWVMGLTGKDRERMKFPMSEPITEATDHAR